MSPAQKAKAKLSSARRLVLKIGSRALAGRKDRLDRSVFRAVAEDVARLREAGKEVALVSSGAILAGRAKLGLWGRALTMPEKQATAAVGQNLLMAEWAGAFARFGMAVGQVLLTAEDLSDRRRYLNSRNTLEELLRLGVVPVINENDTVAVEEIRYGDNDHLSTLVVGLMQADGLVILTDIDGLCAADPRLVPEAALVHEVREGDAELFACAGKSSSGVGAGGMASKIEAARTVARRGVPTVIANGKNRGIVGRIVAGAREGTLFIPGGKPLRDQQYWLAFAGAAKGLVRVDAGARRAVEERGKSLLPSGVVAVIGRFDPGAVVRVEDETGREIARGLTQYSSSDLKKIAGKKSGEIEPILGEKLYDEVIHRDHLVLTSR